ncbi:MAG TPA: energy transducer TonB [Thermoanaerobaculia bacterium]|nr:energy transducer TonB [Thermoanaerobaculia bacterium]
MKRFAIFSLLAFAVSASAATYEARTAHYAVVIHALPAAGDDVVYDVTVSELPGENTLASVPMRAKAGAAVDKQVDVDGQQVSIHLAPAGNVMAYKIEIRKGDVIDSIQSAGATPSARAMYAPGDPPLRVGGDVKAPVVIHRVEPIYTVLARKSRISGIVILEAIIDHTGVVKDVQILKPLPFGLDQAAIDAVKQWTFRPGMLNGQPVDVIFNLTILFRAPEPSTSAVDSTQSSGATQPVLSSNAAGGPPFHVGGDVTPPIVLDHVEPVYPVEARRARISGIVIVEAVIDRAGVVKDVRVIKPLPFGLSEAAIKAVKQWKFRPGTLYGKPVDVLFNLTVNFHMSQPPPQPPPD